MKRLITVTAILSLFAFFGATVIALADSGSGGRVTVSKDCNNPNGQSADACEITWSNVLLLPVHSTIYYLQSESLTTAAGSDVVLLPPPGRSGTARGHCTVDSAANYVGTCTLGQGTGDFEGIGSFVFISHGSDRHHGGAGRLHAMSRP